MPEISIVIPVYNAEQFLPRCLDSVLQQTFQDFELVLVDDGSSDTSGAICDQYAERDARIHVIHKTNGGVSAARNAGIRAAHGRYLMFADSDDYVHERWCEDLYLGACTHPQSVAVCGINFVDEISGKHAGGGVETEDIETNKVKFIETDLYTLHCYGVASYVCNKVFDLSLIRDHGITFDEAVQVSEDVKFNTDYCVKCNKTLMYLPSPRYYYVQRESSESHRYRPEKIYSYMNAFYWRLPLIEESQYEAYCDFYLWYFIKGLDDTFDPRNNLPFLQKLRHNQKIMRSEQFSFCVRHASGGKESPLLMRVLRTRNYYVYWLFQRMMKLRSKI